LNLRPRAVAKADPDKEEEDEDEEEAVLIPSDTYDGLICAECAGGHPFIRHKAGTEGWMMIEASEEGGSSTVIRRRVQVKEEKEEKPEGESYGLKRSAEDEEVVGGPKKPRLEHGDIQTETDHTMTSVQNGVANGGEGQWKGEGDVFLAYGIRDQLKASLDVSRFMFCPLV